jgi:hypothetical protein
MKRKGSNPEREFQGAQNRSAEWKEDPVGRTYDDHEDEPFEGEEEEVEEEDEEDDDLDDEDDLEEDEEEDEEEDDF